jgi:beta-aspartyl-dipeptidase (metallo-type)
MMWLEQGGFADMTADRPDTEGKKGSTFKAVSSLFKTKSSWLSQITLSTDAYGSFPKFDGDGNVISYNVGSPMGMIATVRRLIQLASLPIEEAVKLVTANPAKILGLKSKGQILVGMDADLLVLNASNWELQKVFARGRMVKDGNDVIKGMFE